MATLTQSAMRVASSSVPTAGQLALQLETSQQSVPFNEQGAFAFARIYNNICLVQTDAPLPSPKTPLFLTPVDVCVFRHEFGTMFRYMHRATVPAHDVQVLASLDAAGVLCERDTGVVFLTREMTDQLLRWTTPRRAAPPSRRRY